MCVRCLLVMFYGTVDDAENQPADASNSSNQAPHDSAASIMSTLDQVNQAARKAAEGSTGTWSSPSAAGPSAGEAVGGSEAEELQVRANISIQLQADNLFCRMETHTALRDADINIPC